MATLNLPKPVNAYAGEDELRKPNGIATSNGNGNGTAAHIGDETEEDLGDMGEYRPPRPSDKYKTGMIYPSREIRAIVDKTALHISKSPTPALLESKIRDHQKTDPKFAFLNDEDPYHQYYKYMIEKCREDAEDLSKGILKTPVAGSGDAGAAGAAVEALAHNRYEPRQFEFKVDLPGVTAMDLDILRLTALFHARRGRSFLSSLSVREGRNYQFDFLRPTHSLYGYYNRMVESYQKVMDPPTGTIDGLLKQVNDPKAKWTTLEDGRNRADWERSRRKREDAKAKQKDEEALAYAAIDWQDFVVVETIEFTQNDTELELPPPTNVERLKGMSMAEKRMASMIMEETGAGPTGGEVGLGPQPRQIPTGPAALRGTMYQQQPQAPQQQQPQLQQQQQPVQTDEMDMDDDEEDEQVRLQRIKAEQEQARAREVQRAAMESRGMKIKKDYVPKGINRGSNVATSKCPYCGQSIPEDELSEHIRIELLDPRWKEQKKTLELRRNQHLQLQQGSDISASLKSLAANRTDLFGDEIDEAERKRRDEEEKAKRREREKIVWDGHTASAAKTTDTFHSSFSLDEQIKKMHSRIGLTADNASTGPQVGPQPVPTPMAAGLPTPGGGTAFEGAAISAPPTGPSSSSGPSIHPSRMAAVSSAVASGIASLPPNPLTAAAAAAAPPPPTTTAPEPKRPAEDEPFGGAPVFKRPKVDKLLFGQMYSEIDWISLHPDPIAISIQLPNMMSEKPEYKLDGSVITVRDLPVNTTFSIVRERIKMALDAELPISRMRLDYNGKVMNNSNSLASVNLEEGDTVVLVLKKK